MELGREARRVGVVEAIVTIGTSFVLISLFRVLTRIERRYRAAWSRGKIIREEKLSKRGGKRKLFAVYKLGEIKKHGRFLT